MNAITLEDKSKYTSAYGLMFGAPQKVPALICDELLLTGRAWETETSSSYSTNASFYPTSAGPITEPPPPPTADAILQIRRLSGLTWEELSDLFDVSRRSVHHWASGSVASPEHQRMILQVLEIIRQLYRGSSIDTRSLLLTADSAGVSKIKLLKDQIHSGMISGGKWRQTIAERPRTRLSQAAQDARRPLPQMLLLNADQERPDFPSTARVASAVRVPKAG